jgi:hypothetical protein
MDDAELLTDWSPSVVEAIRRIKEITECDQVIEQMGIKYIRQIKQIKQIISFMDLVRDKCKRNMTFAQLLNECNMIGHIMKCTGGDIKRLEHSHHLYCYYEKQDVEKLAEIYRNLKILHLIC